MTNTQDSSGVPEPQWDLNLLRRQIVHPSFLPVGKRVGSLDTGLSSSERADYTAMVAGVVTEESNGDEPQTLAEPSRLWIANITFGKFAARQMPYEIGRFYERWMPEESSSVAERINGCEFLAILVEDEFRKRNINHRIRWLPASRDKDSKVHRIHHLIRLHLSDRLRLVSALWTDTFVSQAEHWVGTTKNKDRKDDLLDAASLLAQHFIR